MHLALLVSASLVASLLACGTGEQAPAPPPPPAAPRVLLDGPTSCLGASREAILIRDAAAWESWFRGATCGGREVPAVDFSREIVIAASDADAPNGCHDVRIASVSVADGALRVVVERVKPAPEQMCTQAMVRPAAAVAVVSRADRMEATWTDVTAP